MPWAVTLKITDCGNNAKLPGAFVTDGQSTYFTDSYGQFIAVISDYYHTYGVTVGKSDYVNKVYVMNRREHEGTIQTVCLDRYVAPPTPPPTGDGW